MQYLDQGKVTRYAKLKALLKKWGDACDLLNRELKEGLSSGYRCPKGGPYIVSLTEEERSTLSWKEEWEKLAKETYGAKWVTVQAKLVADSRLPQQRLLVSANPDFKEEPAAVAKFPQVEVGERRKVGHR